MAGNVGLELRNVVAKYLFERSHSPNSGRRDYSRSGGGQSSNTIAHFALDFSRKESVCGFNLLRGARHDASAGHLYK